MTKTKPIVGEDEAIYRLPRFVPRTSPTEIPTPNIFDEPHVCLKINAEWASHFIGALDALDQPDTWIATDEEIFAARQQVREAILMLSGECEMCCGETNVLLEQIVNQNSQLTVSNIQQDFNTYITNNNNTQNLNQMLYDGNPQSIYPDAGADFNTTGDGRLCAAIDAYINGQIYIHGNEASNLQFAATGLSGAFIALGALLGVITGGVSIALGLAVSTLIFAAANVWESILNDPDAIRKVKCCMYDALLDQPLTRANFQTSVDSCGFDGGSNEATLAQQISHDNTYYEQNWLAFLRAMAQSADISSDACSCDCTDDIVLVDFASTGCIITPMGNCLYKFYQPTTSVDGTLWFYKFSFRDHLGRCLFIETSDDPSKPTIAVGFHTIIHNCDDIESSFPGGFDGGTLNDVRWWIGHPQQTTYYKITLAP